MHCAMEMYRENYILSLVVKEGFKEVSCELDLEDGRSCPD